MPKPILRRIRKDEAGATATEYALAAMLVAVAAAGAIGTLGTQVNEHYNEIDTAVQSAVER